MPTLLEQAKDLRSVIDSETAAAKTAWTQFDSLRQSAVAEGVDFTKNADAFTKLDEAGKAYDAARDAIAGKEAQWQRLMELAHADQPDSVSRERQEKAEERAASLGDAFVKSAEYQEALPRLKQAGDQPFGHSQPVRLAGVSEMKTLLSSTGVAALYRNDKKDFMVPLPSAPLNLLDVIPTGTTDSDTVEWQKESTWTNAAAETAEGDASPESTLAYTTATSLVEDFTHHLPATKRALADAGQAATLINNRLINGVQVRLQSQIANGNGTSPNIRGMLNVVGINTQALGADTRTDAVHKAMTLIRVQGEGLYQPQFIGIHPSDWEDVSLQKTTDGIYHFGGPAVQGDRTIWGLVPIISTVFAAGTPLVFDATQTQLWFNGGLEVSMSDSHSDFFTKKKVAVMASVRAAFAVFAPKALATVTGF